MPNQDKRNGFNLLTGGGKAARRALRATNGTSALSLMAPGDGYIVTDNVILRAAGGATGPVNGIMEAVALPGAAIGEGPTTYDYVPANTGINIIGIEDSVCEFECSSSVTTLMGIYDAQAIVTLVDTAPNIPLRQSRQSIGAVGTDGFLLVRPVDRVNNDPYAIHARVVVQLRPVNVI